MSSADVTLYLTQYGWFRTRLACRWWWAGKILALDMLRTTSVATSLVNGSVKSSVPHMTSSIWYPANGNLYDFRINHFLIIGACGLNEVSDVCRLLGHILNLIICDQSLLSFWVFWWCRHFIVRRLLGGVHVTCEYCVSSFLILFVGVLFVALVSCFSFKSWLPQCTADVVYYLVLGIGKLWVVIFAIRSCRVAVFNFFIMVSNLLVGMIFTTGIIESFFFVLTNVVIFDFVELVPVRFVVWLSSIVVFKFIYFAVFSFLLNIVTVMIFLGTYCSGCHICTNRFIVSYPESSHSLLYILMGNIQAHSYCKQAVFLDSVLDGRLKIISILSFG